MDIILGLVAAALTALLGKVFKDKMKLSSKVDAVKKLAEDAAAAVKDNVIEAEEMKTLLADILSIVK